MKYQMNVLEAAIFEHDNVTGENDGSMLINYEVLRFQTLRENLIFQQDGAPLHQYNRVEEYFTKAA